MKLLSIIRARSIWLLHLNDLNPRGRSIERNVVAEMAARYEFSQVPDAKEIIELRRENKPVVLEGGQFKAADGTTIDVTLSIFRDGLMADTRCSTGECDRFLSEILTWLHTDIGLLDYRTLSKRNLYVSEIHVESENSLNIVNPAFERFAELLSTKVVGPIAKPKYELGAIGFWIDPEQNPRHIHFRLERQEDVPFTENRYISSAPLETDQHLEALALLESMLTAN